MATGKNQVAVLYKTNEEDAGTRPIYGVKSFKKANSAGPIPATLGSTPMITSITEWPQ